MFALNRRYLSNLKTAKFQNKRFCSEHTYSFPSVKFTPEGERVFTRSEVKLHNTPSDAWVIIDDTVYNVTNWLPYHPGGERKILRFVGKDASVAFEERGHSDKAREVLEEFKIGIVTEKRRFMCNNSDPLQVTRDLGVGPSTADHNEDYVV